MQWKREDLTIVVSAHIAKNPFSSFLWWYATEVKFGEYFHWILNLSFKTVTSSDQKNQRYLTESIFVWQST